MHADNIIIRYLIQGGYVFSCTCLSVCLPVCLLAILRKTTDQIFVTKLREMCL